MAAAVERVIGEDLDFLALLPEATQRQLLQGSTRINFPAGTIAFRPEDKPLAFLVERGLLRIYRSLADGRQATVAFIHCSELAGGTRIVDAAPSVFVQVVVDSTLTILQIARVRALAATDIHVVTAIARHFATQLDDAFRLISIRSLGDVRERLAYDILERACRRQLDAGRLEVRATQTDLADSIGSSREVVGRTIKGMRAAGIVETAHGAIRILEPLRLANILRAFAI
jgi:CRP-like cAMP-binding protein